MLSYPHWSIKDAGMVYRDGVFFSAFYEDHGRVRSHVAEVSTRDFKTYSQPILDLDREEAGWIGMCSPDVQRLGAILLTLITGWVVDRSSYKPVLLGSSLLVPAATLALYLLVRPSHFRKPVQTA